MRDENETGFTRAFRDLGICHFERETNQSRRGETTFTLRTNYGPGFDSVLWHFNLIICLKRTKELFFKCPL